MKESNRYERFDFLAIVGLGPNGALNVGPKRGAKAKAKNDKFKKFPRATKNLLKAWLFDNQDRPYLINARELRWGGKRRERGGEERGGREVGREEEGKGEEWEKKGEHTSLV